MRPRSCLSKIFWSLVSGLDGGCEEVEQRRLRGAGTPSGRRSALTPPLRPLTPLSTPLILYRLHHSLYTLHILLTPLHKYTLDTLRPRPSYIDSLYYSLYTPHTGPLIRS